MNETGAQVVVNYEQNQVAVAFQSVTLFIIISAALLGNCIVMHAIWQDLRMQTIGNIFVFNVGAADFAMSAWMVLSLVALLNGSWSYGCSFCTIDIFFTSIFTRSSLLTLVLISYHKYREICQHVCPNISKRLVYIIIAVTWMLSVLFSVPFPNRIPRYQPVTYRCAYGRLLETDVVKAIEYAAIAIEIASFLLIAFFLWRINRMVWRSKNSVKPEFIISYQRAKMTKKYSAHTTTITLCVYLAMVLPHFVSRTFMDLDIVRRISPGWRVAFYWIFCCHCALKPIIYATRCRRCVAFSAWHISRLLCYQNFQIWKKRNRMETYRARMSSHEKNRQPYLQAAETSTRRRQRSRQTSCEFTDLAAFPYRFEEENFNQVLYSPSQRELTSRSNPVEAGYPDQLKTKNPQPRLLFVHEAEFSTVREDNPLAEIEFSLELNETDSEPSVSSDIASYKPTTNVNTLIGESGDSERNENKRQRGLVYVQRTHQAQVQVDIHSPPKPRSSYALRDSRHQLDPESDYLDEHIDLETFSDSNTTAGTLSAREKQPEVNYKAKKHLRIVPLQLMLPSVLLGDEQVETKV